MKIVKEYVLNMFNGFCMALADSVPGVSGGTIAFLLGFYDKFINSLDDLFRGNMKAKKNALIFLIKLGIGWVIGFLASATILSGLFTTKIYAMSSLFIGFIIAAIPLIVKQELDSFKGKYKNIVFAILGLLLVVGITLLSGNSLFDVNLAKPDIFTYLYVLVSASIAITAMVLPGISGSTLLLVFGLYIPIMNAIKELLSFNFSVLPVLIVFGIGILFGIVFFVKLLRIGLKKFRSQICYTIIGMMVGSLFSIVMGPTTLEEPMQMLTFKSFDILFFLIGIIIIASLEILRVKLSKQTDVK
ncbi:MAG: DUF368 domain-containing protein [Bacilli bacterium]|jgi:putative membrane protein|nr:DUF368 domain-containing protein [Bacilli bacterium]